MELTVGSGAAIRFWQYFFKILLQAKQSPCYKTQSSAYLIAKAAKKIPNVVHSQLYCDIKVHLAPYLYNHDAYEVCNRRQILHNRTNLLISVKYYFFIIISCRFSKYPNSCINS